MNKIVSILSLLRIKQYVKNMFIFIPVYLARRITDMESLKRSMYAFVLFSLITSAIYILNDILDRNDDREHPKKRHRPLAAGKISLRSALALMFLLSTLSFILSYLFLPHEVLILFLLYLCLNILYCFYFKHIAIMDAFIIASGFIIRLFIGSVVSEVELSRLIVMFIFMMALLLVFGKRKDDLIVFRDTGKKMRRSVDGYTLQLLDVLMSISSVLIIIIYILFTILNSEADGSRYQYLYVSSVLIIVGVFRYLQLTHVYNESWSPTEILYQDKIIQGTIVLWFSVFTYMLYV